jgi:hypothetical protein
MPMFNSEMLDDPLLFERDETFRGGVDEYTRPTLLPPGQYARGINTILSDNHEQGSRPGWAGLGTFGQTGVVQGCGYYDTVTGGGNVQQLLAFINSVFKYWDGSSWTNVAGYTPSGTVTMEQAFGKMLITDGVANMRSWDGSAFVDLGSTKTATGDAPVGATMLCFHASRMFASGYPGTQTVASVVHTNDTIWASDLLSFVAGKWNWVDFSFRVGTGDGQAITALASLQGFNLVVFKANSIYLANTPPTAATAASYTIQLLSSGVGCVGKKAWCYAGNDVLFMAQDGVRSLNRMAGAAGQFEVSAPISQPLQPYIDRINWERAPYIVAQHYRQYAIFWVPLDSSTTNNHALVFNTRLGVWVGVWYSGPTKNIVNPTSATLTRFNGNLRLVVGTTDNVLDEWQDYQDPLLDATQLDNGLQMETRIRLRSTQHGEPVNDKDAYYFEARLRDVNNPVSVDFMVDEALAATFTLTPPTGVLMGQISLPFTLAPDALINARKSLDGLTPHNESYLEFYSTNGRFTIKNVTRAAFLNTLQNE